MSKVCSVNPFTNTQFGNHQWVFCEMGLRLRIGNGWPGIMYGPFVGVGLRISVKPLGNDGEIDLGKEGR